MSVYVSSKWHISLPLCGAYFFQPHLSIVAFEILPVAVAHFLPLVCRSYKVECADGICQPYDVGFEVVDCLFYRI